MFAVSVYIISCNVSQQNSFGVCVRSDECFEFIYFPLKALGSLFKKEKYISFIVNIHVCFLAVSLSSPVHQPSFVMALCGT